MLLRSACRAGSVSSRWRKLISASWGTREPVSAISLGQVAVQRRLRNPHDPADLDDAVLLAVVKRNDMPALLGIEQFRATAFATARPGGGKPGLGALADQSALELRQFRKQVEGQLAVDRAGVDPFGQRSQLD